MPEILLVRHGRPVCDHASRIPGCDFTRWVDAYDRAPLDVRSQPSAGLRAQVATIHCLVTSTMRRAVDSAAVLAPGRTALTTPLFDEAGVPTAIRTRLPLAPGHWDVIARGAWFMGWSPGVESFTEARVRATRAADRLADLAAEHDSVMLVGHGMLNTLIARALRRNGWAGKGSPRAYWGGVTLTKGR
jgi:broad specificity phosphatase PhoE